MKITNSPVDPILRIPDVPVDPEFLATRAIDRFERFSLDRMDWMRRRLDYYLGWDDYLSPVRKGLWDGASNLHLPLTEIQATVMHALIMQAMVFNFPWFYVDPQEDIDLARIKKIERFMKYVLERFANYNQGIYFAMDDWAWDLVTDGMGIMSRGWKTEQRRFITVQENAAFKQQRLDIQKMLDDTDEDQFDLLAKRIIKQPYEEKAIVRTVFDGPLIVAEDPAYILFKGDVQDSTDLDRHQTVIKVCYFTDSELRAFSESQYMDQDVIEEVLSMSPDRIGESLRGHERFRAAQDLQTGIQTNNSDDQDRKYEFLCVYDRTVLSPIKKNAMADRLQYFVHPRSRKLARWTYLDRISANGKIPLHMAHLYRRPRRSIGRGVVMTMWGLNDAQDILVNQQIDAGMLSNNPMFAYRGNSTFDPGEVRVEPGLGIKADDPNTDIRFFSWNVNPNWSVPVQGVINSMASQLTSIGPTQSGQVGANVGPLRSTSGVQALAAMGSIPQNVLITRAKLCISGLFEGMYMDCQDRMKESIKISVTGQDGVPAYDEKGEPIRETISKEDLRGRLHFGIYANAFNLTPETRMAKAMAIAQSHFQALPVQTGVVTPQNVFEILANVHEAGGTLRMDRFITKPGGDKPYSLVDEMKMIMQGITPVISLNDPQHQEKIDFMEPVLQSEAAQLEVKYGRVAPNALELLKWAINEHRRFLETINKPSNMENPTGAQISPTGNSSGVGASDNSIDLSQGGDTNVTNMQTAPAQMGPSSGGPGGPGGPSV